jgi:phosphoglycolate phosphatase-like HAD superfamily hydrolase
MTGPTLFIFDIDGTLCETKDIGDNCFIEVFEEMYLCKLGNIQWENFTNVTDTALYNDLYKLHFDIVPTETETRRFKQEYYRQLNSLARTRPQHFKMVEGAAEFCKQSEISIAIATGSWLDVAELKMNACKLDFDNIPISSSNDDGRRTEIVKSVIKKSKQFYAVHTFSAITYFGDGLWDKQCCDELGIDFIGIDTDNNQKLQKAKAKKVYTNFLNIEI